MAKWILGVFIFFVFTPTAWSKEYRLKFEPNNARSITDLDWAKTKDTTEPLLQSRAKPIPGISPYFVILEGHYKRKDRKLLFEDREIRIDGEGKFKVYVDITHETKDFYITEIDLAGNPIRQKELLHFPEWAEFRSPHPKSHKRWSISGGTGLTYLNYEQSRVAPLSEIALSVKLSGQVLIFGPVDIGVSGYYAYPLVSNQGSTKLQFLGLNFRAGVRLLKPESLWDLRILAGYYYLTSFSTGAFGYQNLMGPQIYPSLRRNFSNNRSAWIYFKYSPILDDFSFVALNSAEFASGGGYSFPIQIGGRPQQFAVSVDASLLNLTFSGGGTVRSNTFTLSMTYLY